MPTLREVGSKEWVAGEGLAYINAGNFQRIADACEKMCTNLNNLREERDRYERWFREEKKQRERSERHAIALRGVITKMRKASTGGAKDEVVA